MKLLSFIKLKFNGNISAAARDFGCNKETMRLWCRENEPRRSDRAKIYLWSHGRVTPNDFVDLPEIPAQAGSPGQSDLLLPAGEFAGRFLSSNEAKTVENEGKTSMAATSNGHAMLSSQHDLFRVQNLAEARS